MKIASAVFAGWAMLLIGLSFGKKISCNTFDTVCKKGSKNITKKK